MELRHLRYFVEVARQGSISRASEKLFVAQPALSAQMRQLEDLLGAPLLVRRARGVTLTEAGERLLVEAQGVLAHMERLASGVQQVAGQGARTLRIGFVPSSAHTVLPALVRAVHASQPGARLEAREMITSALLDALAAGALDLAISRPLEAPGGCQVLASLADPYCLALPAAHPLAAGRGPLPLADAAGEDFVAFTRFQSPAYFDRTVALCVEARFSPRLRHEAAGFGNALQLVALGLGVCIVPASLALASPAGVVFRLLADARRADQLVLLAPARALHPALPALVPDLRQALARLGEAVARQIPGAGTAPTAPA